MTFDKSVINDNYSEAFELVEEIKNDTDKWFTLEGRTLWVESDNGNDKPYPHDTPEDLLRTVKIFHKHLIG